MPQGPRRAFTGPNAQYVALTFAYATFGNARMFLTGDYR